LLNAFVRRVKRRIDPRRLAFVLISKLYRQIAKPRQRLFTAHPLPAL
jgi:hypothetical protein